MKTFKNIYAKMLIFSSNSNFFCNKLLAASVSVILLCILCNVFFNFTPINITYIVGYVLLIIMFSIWCTCVAFQTLLRQNQPLDYNATDSKKISFVKTVFIILQKIVFAIKDIFGSKDEKEIIDSKQQNSNLPSFDKQIEINKDISVEKTDFNQIVDQLDQKFISRWYVYLISSEKTFTNESKYLLENVLKRVSQVIPHLDTNKITIGMLAIFLRHIREYGKAKKRAEKNSTSIENVYKYSHVHLNENDVEIFAHRITGSVVKEFLSWELWNSFPCNLLVAVLSKKLTLYLVEHISEPDWIYTKMNLLTQDKIEYVSVKKEILKSVSKKKSEEKTEISNEIDEKSDEILPSPDTVDSSLRKEVELIVDTSKDNKLININKLPIENNELTIVEDFYRKPHSPKTIRSQKVNENLSGKSTENIQQDLVTAKPVIHMSSKFKTSESGLLSKEKPAEIITGKPVLTRSKPVKIYQSTGTARWNREDLESISLGQDLLELESNPTTNMIGNRLWNFTSDSEQDNKSNLSWDEEKSSPENNNKPVNNLTKKENSLELNAAPTSISMKELQQKSVHTVTDAVHSVSDAMHKIGDLQDEAAGYVESVIDFGIAGLKKGLRLTGLQEPGAVSKPSTTPKDTLSPNPITSSIIPNSYSTELKDLKDKIDDIFPTVQSKSANSSTEYTEDILLEESPEYEETADFASTIAKLRSLLQQRSSESNINTPAVSPMPSDDQTALSVCDSAISHLQYVEPNLYPMGQIGNNSSNMQRLDKFLTRTVTGVFNTIKTALPGNISEDGTPMIQGQERWFYAEREVHENDLSVLVDSLLIERRNYCAVDAAVDSLDLLSDSYHNYNDTDLQVFDDDIDEAFVNIPVTHLFFDIICELLKDTNNSLTQEPIIRGMLLLIGNLSEKEINSLTKSIITGLTDFLNYLPETISGTSLDINFDELIKNIENALPYYIKEVIGVSDLRYAINFLLDAFHNKQINTDTCLLILELISSNMIVASTKMSPKTPV